MSVFYVLKDDGDGGSEVVVAFKITEQLFSGGLLGLGFSGLVCAEGVVEKLEQDEFNVGDYIVLADNSLYLCNADSFKVKYFNIAFNKGFADKVKGEVSA